MFAKISGWLGFSRLFLSPDKSEQLRVILLQRSTTAPKLVDMALAVLLNRGEDENRALHAKVKPSAQIKGYDFVTSKTALTCSPPGRGQYIKSFLRDMVDPARPFFPLTFSSLSNAFFGMPRVAGQQAGFEVMGKPLNRSLRCLIPPIFPSFHAISQRWA